MAKTPLVFGMATPTLCIAATLLVLLYGPMETYFSCLPGPNSVRGLATAQSSNFRRGSERYLKIHQTHIVTVLLIIERYIWYQNEQEEIPHTLKASKMPSFR